MKKLLILPILIFLNSCADKKTATENLNLAIEEIKIKNYESAFTYIKSALKQDSLNSTVFYYKGLAETNLKKTSDALISFQKAISLDSNNYEALVERAKLKITLGDIVSAINDCDKARLIKKDYTNIYLTKAHAYERLNDNSNAIIQYECAVQYGEKTGEIFFKIGLLNLNAGKKDVACDYLRKAGDLGFMESFELIKANCNTEEVAKESEKNETVSNTVTTKSESKAPSIKIGDSFTNWESEFALKGQSSKTGLRSYLYNKNISTLICDHQIDKLIVNTKNNKVVTFIYLLLPKPDDSGVPGCLITKLQKQVGAEMVFKNGKYGASDGNVIVSLYRADDPTFGGERIWIYTTTSE